MKHRAESPPKLAGQPFGRRALLACQDSGQSLMGPAYNDGSGNLWVDLARQLPEPLALPNLRCSSVDVTFDTLQFHYSDIGGAPQSAQYGCS